MTTDTTARRTRLLDRMRAQNERDDERRRAEEALPRAICSICGGIVPAGTGTLASDPWSSWEETREWAGIDESRLKQRLAPLMGWRRRHDGCQTTGQMLKAILDVDVPDHIAGAALVALSGRLTARNLWGGTRVPHKPTPRRQRDLREIFGQRDPRPWSHLTAEDIAELRQALAKEQAAGQLRRCVDGACAWCGVNASTAWTRSPERWADGSHAALCADCAEVWVNDGQPADRESIRGAALHALSGARAFALTGLGIRAFCDIAGDDHSGHASPWTYAEEPLNALREQARMTWPGTLPARLREEYVARSRREHRDRYIEVVTREQQAEREREAAQARAAGWPV